jgi:outer membrane protein OmpA-like peptidoglycan-associated protein
MERKAALRIAIPALAITIMAGLVSVSDASLCARAHATEPVNVDTIVNALKKSKARGVNPVSPAKAVEIEDLKRIRKTRGWNLHDRARLAKATEGMGQIDLVVYFAFDSSEIQKEAEPVLNVLGEALARDENKGQSFVLAGHTDAKGTPEYNQGLSERRAEAVKRYIVTRFKLRSDDLLTVGYGFEQLKDSQNPQSATNRRVQVVNFNQ